MRRSVRKRPRCIAAPAATGRATSQSARTERSDWMELARRMSIPDDHAVRQVVDLAIGHTAEQRTTDR